MQKTEYNPCVEKGFKRYILFFLNKNIYDKKTNFSICAASKKRIKLHDSYKVVLMAFSSLLVFMSIAIAFSITEKRFENDIEPQYINLIRLFGSLIAYVILDKLLKTAVFAFGKWEEVVVFNGSESEITEKSKNELKKYNELRRSVVVLTILIVFLLIYKY